MKDTKTLYIMQGISGSGKSTEARKIARGCMDACQVLSTDDYWYERGENPNKYEFVPHLLGLAHKWNQGRATFLMASESPNVVIDNTNIMQKDVEVYLQMARDYGYSVVFVVVDTPLEVALERNSMRSPDRRIPDDVIKSQHMKREDLHV